MAGEIAVWTNGNDNKTVETVQNRAVKAADENRAFNTTQVATETHHSFSFHDLIDMLNPLQHIPIVNQIYRGLTGDTINPAMQVVGDAIYGGPVGGALSLANVIVTQGTGHDLPGTLLAMARGQNVISPTATGASVDVASNMSTASEVASIMPAAGLSAGNTPRQSAYHSLHLNA